MAWIYAVRKCVRGMSARSKLPATKKIAQSLKPWTHRYVQFRDDGQRARQSNHLAGGGAGAHQPTAQRTPTIRCSVAGRDPVAPAKARALSQTLLRREQKRASGPQTTRTVAGGLGSAEYPAANGGKNRTVPDRFGRATGTATLAGTPANRA